MRCSTPKCGSTSNKIVPQITWGTSPEHVIPVTDRIPDPAATSDPDQQKAWQAALDYMGLTAGAPIQDTRVDWVFIGSCTNSRMSDLRDAAQIAKGRKVAGHVRAWVVPGSENIKRRPRPRDSIASSSTPASNGASRAARCAWR